MHCSQSDRGDSKELILLRGSAWLSLVFFAVAV